ncbi:MAG: DHHW family protein [Oscillospiraceae bacterium]|nr:DHHW family protein [Oscillospiraceae bacterium]
MNKICNRINIIAFALVLAAAFPILIFASRPEFSEVERRSLARFPELTLNGVFSGEFMRDLNLFFSDTVPMRDNLAGASSLIKSKLGFSVDGVTFHYVQNAEIPPPIEVIQHRPQEDNAASQTLAQTESPKWDGVIAAPDERFGENSEENEGENDDEVDISSAGVLVHRDRALMIVGWVSSAGERYASVINEYKRRLNNIDFYSMVIPSSIEFYCPVNYLNHYGIDQRESINNINSFLDDVTPVNVYSALSRRVALGENVYLRTDHHWAALGAYYAAEQFALTAGVPFAPLSSYEKVKIENFIGTMYGYSGRNPAILNNPEDFIYYKPANDYSTTYYIIYEGYDPELPVSSSLFLEQPVSESYCTFMGGDTRITHITTDVDTTRTLAVFKDSFGNALIPFLTGSFKEIYVIDIRFFPYNAFDYLKAKGVTDVLFANNIAVANDPYFIELIEKLL